MNFKISDHFDLIEKDKINEYKTNSFLYEHKKTGAKVLFYQAPNPNCAFSIFFPTPVFDSRGITHILEHCVFEGSKNFPNKGNFQYLINNSLCSYLNAGTYQDKTMYYFASSFEKDFENVMDIYLDFVFYPLLEEKTFRREGFFFTHDETGNYKFNGIVYNEMKDALLSFDSKSFYGLMKQLFPNSTFSHLQGGNPLEISDLTLEDIKKYHEEYYHPSNSYSIVYGKVDQKKIFKKLHKYFDSFEKRDYPKPVRPTPIDKPSFFVDEYQDYNHTELGSYTFSLTFEEFNYETGLGITYLVDILLKYKFSPLRRVLEDSGLFLSIHSYEYFDFYQTPVFNITFTGVAKGNEIKIKSLILEKLKELSKNIDKDTKEAVYKSMEFDLKETYLTDNLGIHWITSVAPSLMYGKEYNLSLKNLYNLKIFKKYSQGKKLELLLKKYFLNNTSTLDYVLLPSKDLINSYNAQEVEKMNLSISRISDLNQLDQEIKSFEEWKNEPYQEKKYQNLHDIKSSDMEYLSQNLKTKFHGKIIYTELPINDLCKSLISFDISDLHGVNLDYLPVYLATCMQMSSKNYHFSKFISERKKYFGDFKISFNPVTNHETQKLHLGVTIILSYLHRDFAKAKSLLTEFFQNLVYDNPLYLKQLLQEFYEMKKQDLDQDPNKYAESQAFKDLSSSGFIDSKIVGFDSIRFVNYLILNFEEKQHEIVRELENVHRAILSSPVLLSVGGDPKFEESLIEDTKLIASENNLQITSLKELKEFKNPSFEILGSQNYHYLGNSDTNFNILAMKYPKWDLKNYAKMSYVVTYLRKYLMDEIRIKRGAYGVRCYHDYFESILFFSSYSDPCVQETYETYENYGSSYLISKLTTDEFEQMKVRILSNYKRQVAPDVALSTATFNLLSGVTDESRQEDFAVRRDLTLEELISLFDNFKNPLYKIRFTVNGKKMEEMEGEKFYEVKLFAPQQ